MKAEYGHRAIADFNEAVRLDPRNAKAFYNRGSVWTFKGNFDQAIADYSAAIRLNPKDIWAYGNRGAAWASMGEFDQAIADYNEAIRLDPRYARAYHNRGLVRASKGEFDQAIADYNEAIRLNPKHARAPTTPGPGPGKRKASSTWRSPTTTRRSGSIPTMFVHSTPCAAWLRATCFNAAYRDGAQAVASATRACELTGWKNAAALESLGAACAEAGEFTAAVNWQVKALWLYADENGKEKGRSLLELYREKKPYHEEPLAQ